MLAAAAWLGAGLLPGRAALRQQSPATLRVALRLQERADPAQSWASSYDLASEEVTIETSSSTAGPLEAYETAEKPAEEGAVRAAEERTALILLSDASGWQGEDVRALADRRVAPLQHAPPLPLPLALPLHLAPHVFAPPRARLAIFCGCAVLLPDLLRAEPPCTAPRESEAYQAWLHVHCMCTACALHVHCMCTAHALHAHCMHTTACTLCKHCTHTACARPG